MSSSSQALEPVAPLKDIDFTTLRVDDKRVLDRAAYWVTYPVLFCIEAAHFTPYWYQTPVLDDTADAIAVKQARQTGKSQIIAAKTVHKVFTAPNSCALIVSPSQRQSKLLYRKMTQFIRGSRLLHDSVRGDIKVEETEFHNGSLIVNVPATSETIRGHTVDLLIIEEAAYVPEDVWDACEEMLISTYGQEVVISTPRGKSNRFYECFHPTDNQESDWSTYSYDYKVGLDVINPRTGKPQVWEKHVFRRKRRMPYALWRQEYMADFVEDINQYFSEKILAAIFNDNLEWLPHPQPGNMYYMGIDVAKRHDSTVIWVNEVLHNNPQTGLPLHAPHLRAAHITEIRGRDYKLQLPEIHRLVNYWKPIRIYFDRTGVGEGPFEDLQYAGYPVEGIAFTMQKKVQMYGNIYHWASLPAEIAGWTSKFQIPTTELGRTAFQQFQNLEYEIPQQKSSQTGQVYLSNNYHIRAPSGKHDDYPTAGALACLGIIASTVTPVVEEVPRHLHIASAQPSARIRAAMSDFGFNTPDSARRRSTTAWMYDD